MQGDRSSTEPPEEHPARHSGRLTVLMVADLSEDDVAAFQAYEAVVLPLLARHHGALERRLRSAAGVFEAHLITFADNAGYQAYLADPARVAARRLLEGRDLQQRVILVEDVGISASAELMADRR